MSWKNSALASLVGALATAVLLPAPLRPTPGPGSAPPAPSVVQTTPRPSRPPEEATPPAVHPRTPTTFPPVLAFHWSWIESDDYRRYTANLRAIGCPEKTLRDILRADLAEALAPSGVAPAGRGDFWSADYHRSVPSAGGPTAVETALASLVGPDTAAFPDLSFLPEAEAKAVTDWREQFDALEEELARNDTEDDEARSELAQRRDRELAARLGPAQLEDYQLRHSHLADELRSNLVGFEVDADEFRRLFQACRAERQAAEEGRFESADDTLRSVLGEERFARYRQAREPGFRDLFEEVMAAGQSYETALALKAEIDSARLAASAGDPTAPDLASLGRELRARLGPEMHVLFLEHVGR